MPNLYNIKSMQLNYDGSLTSILKIAKPSLPIPPDMPTIDLVYSFSTNVESLVKPRTTNAIEVGDYVLALGMIQRWRTVGNFVAGSGWSTFWNEFYESSEYKWGAFGKQIADSDITGTTIDTLWADILTPAPGSPYFEHAAWVTIIVKGGVSGNRVNHRSGGSGSASQSISGNASLGTQSFLLWVEDGQPAGSANAVASGAEYNSTLKRDTYVEPASFLVGMFNSDVSNLQATVTSNNNTGYGIGIVEVSG